MKSIQIQKSLFVIISPECFQKLRYKSFMWSKIEGTIPSKYLDLLRLNKPPQLHQIWDLIVNT